MKVSTEVINLADARVLKGQRAWASIKTTAAEQRELWRQVGEALLVGRRLHKANQQFSQWCAEAGFDMERHDRADAMWLAQNWVETGDGTPSGLTHPHRIRAWFNENTQASTLGSFDEDLTITPAVELDQRSAERLAKVINRAKSGGEGSDIAKRHLEAVAKKHSVTAEKLEEAVSHAAPYAYFQFSPAQVQSLVEFRQDVLQAYRDMREEGLTKEAVVALYMNIVQEIQQGE
jgi:hypothetical protein